MEQEKFDTLVELSDQSFKILSMKLDLILNDIQLRRLDIEAANTQFEYLRTELELISSRQNRLERFLGWYFRRLAEMNPSFRIALDDLEGAMQFDFGEG